MKLNLIKAHFIYVNRFSHQARQGMPSEELKWANHCGIVAPHVWHHYPMRL